VRLEQLANLGEFVGTGEDKSVDYLLRTNNDAMNPFELCVAAAHN
jgi:hypothetical protein